MSDETRAVDADDGWRGASGSWSAWGSARAARSATPTQCRRSRTTAHLRADVVIISRIRKAVELVERGVSPSARSGSQCRSRRGGGSELRARLPASDRTLPSARLRRDNVPMFGCRGECLIAGDSRSDVVGSACDRHAAQAGEADTPDSVERRRRSRSRSPGRAPSLRRRPSARCLPGCTRRSSEIAGC